MKVSLFHPYHVLQSIAFQHIAHSQRHPKTSFRNDLITDAANHRPSKFAPSRRLGEETKSRQELRIRTGVTTNKTAGQMGHHVDNQLAMIIRSAGKIVHPNLQATNKASPPPRLRGSVVASQA